MKTIKFVVDVSCNDQYCDSRPDKAVILIDKERMDRIIELSEMAKKHDVYQISEFDYTPEWIETGVKDSDLRIEASMLRVTDDSFSYIAFIKHTDIEVWTKTIYIKRLKRKWRENKNN